MSFLLSKIITVEPYRHSRIVCDCMQFELAHPLLVHHLLSVPDQNELTGTKCESGFMNSNSNPVHKVIRGFEALESLMKLNDPPSGLSVISRKYKPTSVIERNGGQRAIYEFANGYAASVVNSGMSYGGLELAVLDSAGNLTYDTPVTENVECNLDADRLDALLTQIEALPKAEAAA